MAPHRSAVSIPARATWTLALVTVVAVIAATLAPANFPSEWRLPVGEVLSDVMDWGIANGAWAYAPFDDAIEWLFVQAVLWLQVVHPLVLAACLVAGVWYLTDWSMGLLTLGALVWVVALGLWVATLETLVLMVGAAAFSSTIGLAVGVTSGLSARMRLECSR